MKKALPIVMALVIGLATGVWWAKPVSESANGFVGEENAPRQYASGVDLTRHGDDVMFADERGAGAASEEEENAVPPPTVEIVVDDSPAPEAEILEAHAARQARRRAARESKEKERHDFLSRLNLDLLTAEQRKLHALYIEANETRNALRKEICALRKDGKEVPADLQARLSGAESVLRTDRDRERRALYEAAARAAGLDESAVWKLLEDVRSIDRTFE